MEDIKRALQDLQCVREGKKAVVGGLVHISVSDTGLGISGRQRPDSKRFISESLLPGSEQVLS